MATHEGDGHEVAKCEDCSVNLRSKSSHKPRPAAGTFFECDHQGCDYKSRWKRNLLSHQKLRLHMLSQHQTNDHDIADCDNCVSHLKKNHILSQARVAFLKRRTGKEVSHLTAANKQDVESSKKKAEAKNGNSFAYNENAVASETNGLNEDLIDMHMNMQLLSSL